MDEYGYFQKKGKGKGKKGKKGKDDEGKRGKPGDGKGKSIYVQSLTSSTPAHRLLLNNNNNKKKKKLTTLQQHQVHQVHFLGLRLILHVWMF